MAGIITDGPKAGIPEGGLYQWSQQDTTSFIGRFADAGIMASMSGITFAMKYPVLLRPSSALLALFASALLHAEEPRPFHVDYEAHYGNLEASAERSLEFDGATNEWRLASLMQLQLFGTTVTEIEETSRFAWKDNAPVPQRYEFEQRGIGSRSRNLQFIDGKEVQFAVNDKQGTLSLTEPAYDDLNSFLVLREQLRQGVTDISFTVVDRDELKPYHYRVSGEEVLKTPQGSFKALRIDRVREGDNDRTTQLWLALEHDYLLLKLVQQEPDRDTITLELEKATLDGQELKGS